LITGQGIQSEAWEWTDTDLHEDAGNLGFADGSVRQSSLKGFNDAYNDTKNAFKSGPTPATQKVVFNMP
jgi:prepilin-type processing-associated H-X9-DG protein